MLNMYSSRGRFFVFCQNRSGLMQWSYFLICTMDIMLFINMLLPWLKPDDESKRKKEMSLKNRYIHLLLKLNLEWHGTMAHGCSQRAGGDCGKNRIQVTYGKFRIIKSCRPGLPLFLLSTDRRPLLMCYTILRFILSTSNLLGRKSNPWSRTIVGSQKISQRCRNLIHLSKSRCACIAIHVASSMLSHAYLK